MLIAHFETEREGVLFSAAGFVLPKDWREKFENQ